MPYCDDFWHIDAHENILSPACLTVFVKSKTENQLIRFVIIAYLVAGNNVKCETVAQRETADFITPDLWPPNSPDLNTVYTEYVEYCSNVFIGNLLKTER